MQIPDLYQYGRVVIVIVMLLYLDYEYPVYVQGPEGYTIRYSGLRISKIEDIDQNNVSNVYTYLYGKYDGSNNFNPITTLNQPVNFSTFTRRHIQGVHRQL
jgi:hypothetical protein